MSVAAYKEQIEGDPLDVLLNPPELPDVEGEEDGVGDAIDAEEPASEPDETAPPSIGDAIEQRRPKRRIVLAWGEGYDEVVLEAGYRGMVDRHWAEAGTYNDILSLNPDHERYRALERAGHLHILTAREGDRLIGYFFIIVQRNPRDTTSTVGSNDTFYVEPEYRRAMVGWKMAKAAVARLKAIGITVAIFRGKHAGLGGAKYLERLGFRPLEVAYGMILNPPPGATT